MKLVVVVVVAVSILAVVVDAQSMYACWGGCYNKCFIGARNSISQSQKLACDYQCLNTCIPSNAADYAHYCHLGCFLKRCTPLRNGDGARLEKCFGWCTDLCSDIVIAP
ncbi:uncharacterized protein LOC131015309 [Salvia miltiorrhiza]|uniref:uncharacterized protein LOC131015309 n=1 Tax=Salvia miltiorrhiza TaxID=226208 RepID=UPI0025ABAEAA|nr:uncharacterized protein LOC131015309 [Salvia miltiorrhiza]